jgi:hypothetical protein
MNLALSIFDVFTYAIPGSIYLAVLIYISNRLDWIRVEAANDLKHNYTVLGAVLASYLLGHITYQLGRAVEHMLPIWKQGLPDPKRVFLTDVPKSKGEFLARLTPTFFLLRLRFEQRRQPLRSTDFAPSDLCFEIAFLHSSSPPQFQSLKSLLAKNACSQHLLRPCSSWLR